MGAGSVDTLWPFQRVLVESTLPAVAMGPVMMVTLVTAPAAVTQVLGEWPVSCAGMDSMELPAKVSSDNSFLVRLRLDADGVSSAASQPVTVQNTGHVTVDAEVQVHVSVMPAGRENAVKVTKVSDITSVRTNNAGSVLMTACVPLRSCSSVFSRLLSKRRLSGKQHLCVSAIL